MELKYIKPLTISAIINAGLGAFLFICGILEFTNILPTRANTIYRTVGVQLSHLVFISGILLIVSGGLTFLFRKTMELIDLQIFIGVAALAWPIFVSIALFFTTVTINIRLVPSILSALFYVISILLVKMSNESLRKSHRINTNFGQIGKRKQSVDVGTVLGNTVNTQKTSAGISTIRGLAESFKQKNATAAGAKIIFSGGRRRMGFNPFKMAVSGQRRRHGIGLIKRIYAGGRHKRRGFRR